MAVRYRFHRATRLLIARAGQATDEEALLTYAQCLAGDPDVPPGRDELVDLRAVDGERLTTAGLRRVAQAFEAHEKGEPARVAIIASSDLAFGLSRMYQAYRSQSSTEIRVFRDLEEACRWLELDAVPEFPADEGVG